MEHIGSIRTNNLMGGQFLRAPVALLCYSELNEPQRGIHRFRIESLSQNGQGSAESRTERHQDPSRGERSLGDHPKQLSAETTVAACGTGTAARQLAGVLCGAGRRTSGACQFDW